MSPIIINSTVNNNLSKPKMNRKNADLEVPSVEAVEENTEKAREERRATGRTIAIIIFVVLMCTAIYHVIQKKTTVLTGVRLCFIKVSVSMSLLKRMDFTSVLHGQRLNLKLQLFKD